jgi:hypothetical protein
MLRFWQPVTGNTITEERLYDADYKALKGASGVFTSVVGVPSELNCNSGRLGIDSTKRETCRQKNGQVEFGFRSPWPVFLTDLLLH